MKSLIRKVFCSAITLALAGSTFAVLPSIRNVTAHQRHPWNGMVDITYEVVGDIMTGLPSDSAPGLVIWATDQDNGYVYPASELTGDTDVAEGFHRVVWNLDAQGVNIDLRRLRFTVEYRNDVYCIIDLSGGVNATTYPVSYRGTIPDGGWTKEYKTQKLVLRRIEAGWFKMQSKYDIKISRPFYMSVFELADAQKFLLTGSGNINLMNSAQINWDVACGNSNSITNQLGMKTGLPFSVPTEAMWEYASCATTNRVVENSNDQIGLGRPNGWGLYGMCGAKYEWCLDMWYGPTYVPNADTDPQAEAYTNNGLGSNHSLRSTCDKRWSYSGTTPNQCRLSFVQLETTAMGEICSSESEAMVVQIPVPDVITTVGDVVPAISAASEWFGVNGAEYVTINMDGNLMFSTTNAAWFAWQPQNTGRHTLKCTVGGTTISDRVFTKIYNITAVEFENDNQEPNPPTAEDPNVWITSETTTEFSVNGGKRAINTGGTGTWTASTSVPWIVIGSTTGSAGTAVMFQVNATTNVEERSGYVYVSGHSHLVKQAGYVATINPISAEFEMDGGVGTIGVDAPAGIAWQARSNVPWISVSPMHGSGSNDATYHIAPFNEVTTRSGSLTIAGKTFTVNQIGRRMKLNPTRAVVGYETHVVPIEVNALASTIWDNVVPHASWISVVDDGIGHGGGTVAIAVSENPSYKSRRGLVSIGTDSFSVLQEGRTALEFSISPIEAEANWNGDGANGRIEVHATPDLPWNATSEVDWIEITDATRFSSGNGNVDYVLRKNWTLDSRSGAITLTAADGSVQPQRHRVIQGASPVSVYPTTCEFEATGGSAQTFIELNNNVRWGVFNTNSWVHVVGETNRMASGTVVLTADANDSIYSRYCQIIIAKQVISISQKGRYVAVSCDETVFSTEGGSGTISVMTDGDVSWTAVSSDSTWLQFWGCDSGVGSRNDLEFVVSPYVWDGTPRTGRITIGDEVIYITQRAYPCSISPQGGTVPWNNGVGEFSVSASVEEVWQAIRTEPWITIITGYDSGMGNGVVKFACLNNDTGKMRTGQIIVNGEVYMLQQNARTIVTVDVSAGPGGTVAGGGAYDLGSSVTLTAIADDGYRFAGWTGSVESVENPLTITADTAKSVTALFEPAPLEITSVTSSEEGVVLVWNNLAWAQTYHVYRGEASVPSSGMEIATIANDGNCTFKDTSGVIETLYWYWVEATGADAYRQSDPVQGKKNKPIVISSISYANLRGAVHSNPGTYTEGNAMVFSSPSILTGYTFTGWQPTQITVDMTGPQLIQATWMANAYTIKYSANGGSGTMAQTPALYDAEVTIPENGFTWVNHEFLGWSASPSGEVAYAVGDVVSNLTASANGVVMLYAVWQELLLPPMIMPGDGSVFYGEACEVAITCPTTGADIYYTTNGTTPKTSSTYLYTGPFVITDTAIIKAVAMKDAQKSEYSTAIITREVLSLKLEDVLGVDESIRITTGDNIAWEPIVDSTASNGLSAKSGGIGDGCETWLQATVSGIGTLMFNYKVSCEHDDAGTYTWDRLRVYVDNQERIDLVLDGESGWLMRTIEFTDNGIHTVRWVYHKDDVDADGDDCAWVSGLTWVVPPDPIPVIREDADVAAALDGSTDINLVMNIVDKTTYDDYRAWVERHGLNHQFVKNSPRAWISYLLDSPTLIEGRLKKSDLFIASFVSDMIDGFVLELGINGITIGNAATHVNLINVLGVEGATCLGNSNFSSENVSFTFGTSRNGKATILVKPKDAAAESFFIRATLYDYYGDNPTVTFNLNGGDSLGNMESQITVDVDSKYGVLPKPARTGYTFDGWYTETNGGTLVTESTIVTNDLAHTLYAHWMANTYTVMFNPNGGSVSSTSKTVMYGQNYGVLPIPVYEGHSFDGWYTEADGGAPILEHMSVAITSNRTFYAHWSDNTSTVEWQYKRNANGMATITGVTNQNGGDIIGALIIPSFIEGCPVISIGESAFNMCHGLTNVVIPEGVVEIGDYAFARCSGLKNVVFPNSLTNIGGRAFHACNGLTTVTIPRSVMKVSPDTFYSCTNLEEYIVSDDNPYFKSDSGLLLTKDGTTLIAGVNGDVVIPSSVNYVKRGAFSGCAGLTNITIPDSVTVLDNTFTYCTGLKHITIPQGVRSLGGAFRECISLESVTIPNSVTNLNSSFVGCTGLRNVTIPSGVTKLSYTFQDCSGLRSLTIPNSVTNLYCTFSGCTGLKEIVIPDSVTSINSAFVNCKSLTTVVIPDSVVDIYGTFNNCTGLTHVTLPVSVTRIDNTFMGCTGLKSVTIPDSVITIGDNAFSGCRSLVNIVIPSSTTTILSRAFMNCVSLTNVEIPCSVIRISNYAFSGCSSLSQVMLPSTIEGKSAMLSKVFPNCSPNLTIIYY